MSVFVFCPFSVRTFATGLMDRLNVGVTILNLSDNQSTRGGEELSYLIQQAILSTRVESYHSRKMLGGKEISLTTNHVMVIDRSLHKI